MVRQRPRDDDELVDDEKSGEEGGAPAGGGGRLAFLSSLKRAPALLKGALRPLSFTGAVVMLGAWTWMLWQLVASTTALNASVETLAGEVQQWGAAIAVSAPASSGPRLSVQGHPPAGRLVLEDASAGGAPEQAETTATEPDAGTEGSAADQVDDEPPVVTLLGRPVLTDGADSWDCLHFENWEQADLVYRANLPHDPNILDFDGNGVPCESLPGAP